MIRRLLTAWTATAALLPCAAAVAGPKPADLPPRLEEPLPPLQNTELPPQVLAPAPRPAVDDAGDALPETHRELIDPVYPELYEVAEQRPSILPSERRRVISSLLFGAHPLLTPAAKLIPEPDEEDETPARPECPQSPPLLVTPAANFIPEPGEDRKGSVVIGVGLAHQVPLGLGLVVELQQGGQTVWQAEAPCGLGVVVGAAVAGVEAWQQDWPNMDAEVGQQEGRIEPTPETPRAAEDGELTCPYLRQRCDPPAHTIIAPDDPLLGETVEKQFEKLKVADKLCRHGRWLHKHGRYEEAMACYDKARSLCPGSSYEARANKAIGEIFCEMMTHDWCGGAQPTQDAEEPGVGKDGPSEEERPATAKPGPRPRLSDAGKVRNEHYVERRLSQPVSWNFNNKPLRDVLDGISAAHNLNIHVDITALEQEGVTLDRPVTIKLEEVSLRSSLNLVLHDLHLTYVIQDGVLVVTTKSAARARPISRVYAVADLLEDEVMQPQPGETKPPEALLIDLIAQTVEPRSWATTGGSGTIDYFPQSKALVVNQTADVHEQIDDLLAALRRLKDDREEARRREVEAAAVQASHLLKACRLAYEDGRAEKARQLAREASALCPTLALADPLAVDLLARWVVEHLDGGCDDSRPTCPFQPQLPPVDFRIPCDFNDLLKGDRLRLEIEEDVPPPQPVEPESDLEFELEVPNFDLTIPEMDQTGFVVPVDLASWALRMVGVTCAEVSGSVGQVRLAAQFTLGGNTFRVRYDGDFELSVLPTAPCP